MQLKRLEAYGFKSFADKTEIVFHPGITAIVGPNGSGKSNITDAIRWVLGEQNPRNLRASKAEDIIFSGSSDRKPLNVAEVSLVFDNTDGTLPIAYQEVIVTRRLFRSGESESYINHTRCRIKDVYQLFADTGIGHEGMSIIGQNRIDRVLNSRPEERRAFFEETAGITKYKARKGEALRKMEMTEKNLVRVRDIMQEIKDRLAPLAKHAEKTRAYEELSHTYRRYEISSLSQKYEILGEQRTVKQSEKETAREQQLSLVAKIEKKEAAREQAKVRVVNQEAFLQKIARQEQSLQERTGHVQTELAARKERHANEDIARTRLLEQQRETEQEMKTGEQFSEQLKEEITENTKKAEMLRGEITEGKARASDSVAELTKAKEVWVAAQAEESKQREHTNAQKQSLAVLEKTLEWSRENQQEKDARCEEWKKRIVTARARQEEAQRNLCDLQREKACVEKRLSELAVECRETREKLSKEQTLQQNRRAQEKGLASRRKILEHMQQTYEGFGAAARAVLHRDEKWGEGVCGAVAELIKVPGQYVTALEVALSGSQQHIVTKDTETAKAAITYLKRRHLGRVTFLPLTSLVVQIPMRADDILGLEGAIGFANSLVHIEERYRRVADFLLGRTLVVDTLDHAISIAKKRKWRQRIVTLEGELIHAGGSLSGGGRTHREASFLGRRSELELCRKELEKLEAESAVREKRMEELSLLCSTYDEEQKQLVQKRQQQSVLEAELKTSLASVGETLQQEESGFQEFLSQQEAQHQSFVKAQEGHSLLRTQVGDAEEQLRRYEKISAEKKETVDDLAEKADAFQHHVFGRETEYAVLLTKLEQDRLRSEDTQELIKQKKQVLASIQGELSRVDAAKDANSADMETLAKELEQLHDTGSRLRQQKDACYTEKMHLIESDKKLEQEIKALSMRQKEQQNAEHQVDLQLSKIEYAIEECTKVLFSQYGLTPDSAADQRLDLAPDVISRKLQELKKDIEALGPVNPAAVKEYEEQRKRLDFMQKQSQDLEDAKENLATLIGEMDHTMTQQFQRAFTKIQQYFQQCFAKLFGGGKAELKLLNADALHAGVDILVTLPHKKRQGLSALSGGERALTVIALLFAFLTYKPSPFSVLDEIDAPLDEANVVRFGSFLKELSHSTQFIVVTHRKGTMEAVDTMYGVTTDGIGVSKILSVRLDEIAG